MRQLLDKSALLVESVVGRMTGASLVGPDAISLVDFGADTVKVAVIRREDAGLRVLGTALTSSGGGDLSMGRASVAVLAEAAEKALSGAEDQTVVPGQEKVVPDKAVFCVPARLTKGQAFVVRHRRADPSVAIGQRELRGAWDRLEKMVKDRLPGLAEDGVDWRPLALTPGVMRIDGLQVSDPVGMKGRVVALEAFGIAVWPAVLRALEAVARRLELELIDVVAAPHSLAAVAPQRDAVLLDVGWSGTSINLVRHNSLASSHWWAQGGDFFTGRLAEAFRCSLEDAEALKRAHASDDLSASDMALVDRPLGAAMRIWRDSLVKRLGWMLAVDARSERGADSDASALVGNLQEDVLPGRFYITGGGSLLPGLVSTVRSVESEAGLSFARSVEVESLGSSLGTREGSMPVRLLDIPSHPLSDVLAPVISLAACANW
jgi:cell division ATPase FtsA